MKGPTGELYVDDGGQGGIAVVFVHAAAGHSGQWAAQLKHLRKERRALAIDLRGHGQSRATLERGASIEDLAADVGAVVDGLGLKRFVLVGHSMGGAVCVAYAGQHPERVAGLFLLDPASDGRQIPAEMAQGIFQAMESDAWLATVEEYWAPMLQASRPEVREAVLTSLRRTPRDSVVAPMKALFRFDPVTPLKRYQGPRLTVITGFNEEPGSLQRLVPDLPHQKIADTGHWVQLDAPDQVNTILDGFLARIR